MPQCSFLSRRRWGLSAVLVLAAVTRATALPPIETGELNGAKFAIAVPGQWNRHVLLLAHGYRAEDRPLVADLFPGHLAYQTLLDEGWIVAKTSYRRNGIIVADALADLDALRDHIAAKHGAPSRVLVEGESMGGFIGVLIAEREPDATLGAAARYAGVIAIGAALQTKEPNATLGLSLQPKIPLVFLTNQSEFEGPRHYVNAAVPPVRSLRPLLLRVARDGHVNVNQRERLAALQLLTTWLDRGAAAVPEPREGEAFIDITVPPEPQPSRVTPHPDGRGFDARVVEISAVYGNIFLDAQPADFAAAGIRRLTWFQLTAGGKTFRVFHGRDFNSVKRTEWVAFANADGFTWLARNFADAAAAAGLSVGDVVSLRRFDEPARAP